MFLQTARLLENLMASDILQRKKIQFGTETKVKMSAAVKDIFVH